jgi:NAD(P)-dependent dehydrogenase (short-subunit alcohol dehydrogenase family)
LGLALACRFAAEGANVVLVGRAAETLAAACDIVEERTGSRPRAVCADVTLRHEVNQVVEHIVAECGSIDVLVDNAGTMAMGPVEHMRERDFARALATHFWGPLFAMLAAIPRMRAQGGGRIVNVGSVSGRVAVPHLLPYVASKFALTGLSDAMRAELAKDRIYVTTVTPGPLRTGSYLNAEVKGQYQRELAWLAILDSMPLLSMDVQYAARRIVDACRYGEPSLTLGVPAKLAVLAQALAPNLVGRLMAIGNRFLPAPRVGASSVARRGWQSRSRWAPSFLTRKIDAAAAEYNELDSRGDEPAAREGNGQTRLGSH